MKRASMIGLLGCLGLLHPGWAGAQGISKAALEKVDAIVVAAYQTAAAKFPCKIKDRGKFKVAGWQAVDACLNDAASRVDWESLSAQLGALRQEYRLSDEDLISAFDAALGTHALPFEKVLTIKQPDALLPLTNSLLKFLPADSLQALPVFDKSGTRVGIFSGVYYFERAGGLATANTYKLAVFQFTDPSGNVQSASDKLLLDSFGVPWRDAAPQPGFRLTSDRVRLPR